MSVGKGTSRTEALYRLGRETLHRAVIDQLWKDSIRSIEECLGTDIVEVSLIPSGEQTLWLNRSLGPLNRGEEDTIVPTEEHGYSAFVLQRSEGVILADADSEERFDLPPSLLELDVKSGIACPIEAERERLGVLSAYSQQPGSFSADDLAFVTAIADLLANGLQREGMCVGLDLACLAARTLSDARDMDEVFDRLSDALVSDLGFARVQQWLPTRGRDLECRSSRGAFASEPVTIEERQVVGSALAARRPIFTPIEAAGDRAPGLRGAFAMPILKHGTPLGVIAIFTRKRMFPSEDLMKALTDIGALVGDVVENGRPHLPQRRKEEREQERNKDQFLMMLGHELRNPLAAIRSAVEVLRWTSSGNVSADRALDAIDRQCGHMLRLVTGLLDVGRIARGKLHLEPEDLDLGVLLRNSVEDHDEQLANKRLHVSLDLRDEPLRVIGDRTRMMQVFDNLLTNAIKFTPAGGSISVSAHRELDRGIIRFVDTGVGIAPEQRDGIFRPFVQVGSEARGAGLGLGLTLTKLLVELHGGTLEVESEGLGKGSCFKMKLPVEALDLASYRSKSGPRRILIVEDEEDSVLVSQLLQRSGHEVRCIAKGEEAIDVSREWQPDVIFCALDLPGRLTGNDVARTIRSDPELGASALIALTGYGEQSKVDSMFDAQVMTPAALDDIERAMDEVARRQS